MLDFFFWVLGEISGVSSLFFSFPILICTEETEEGVGLFCQFLVSRFLGVPCSFTFTSRITLTVKV